MGMVAMQPGGRLGRRHDVLDEPDQVALAVERRSAH